MARPFWKGTLSFGLVEITVTLRPARADHGISFTLLDRADFAPVGYKRYNKHTGEEVPWERVVRGYEYDTDQYVTLTDEELEQANVEASRTVELVAFVDRGQIPPIYYETPYYVEPQKRASKSYGLLRTTLEKTGLIGIARVVLRTRQHVAALLVHGDMLMLNTLRYAEELRPAASGEEEDGDAEREEPGRRRGSKRKAAPAARRAKTPEPTAAELRMATRLVEEMRGDWSPGAYRDEYRQDVMELVEKKVKSGKTHEIVAAREAPEPRSRPEVTDLMSLLTKSLERRGPARARASRGDAARREAPKRRRRA